MENVKTEREKFFENLLQELTIYGEVKVQTIEPETFLSKLDRLLIEQRNVLARIIKEGKVKELKEPVFINYPIVHIDNIGVRSPMVNIKIGDIHSPIRKLNNELLIKLGFDQKTIKELNNNPQKRAKLIEQIFVRNKDETQEIKKLKEELLDVLGLARMQKTKLNIEEGKTIEIFAPKYMSEIQETIQTVNQVAPLLEEIAKRKAIYKQIILENPSLEIEEKAILANLLEIRPLVIIKGELNTITKEILGSLEKNFPEARIIALNVSNLDENIGRTKELPLPKEDDILKLTQNLLMTAKMKLQMQGTPNVKTLWEDNSEEALAKKKYVADILKGLTEKEIIVALKSGLVKEKKENYVYITLNKKALKTAKIEVLKEKEKMLSIIDPDEIEVDELIGFEGAKEFVEWAIKKGKERSLLFVGIPGTGKTLFAKYIAKKLNLPLIEVNPDMAFGKYVGETEQNTQRLIQRLNAVGKAIVLFDEIEKIFSVGIGTHETTLRALRSFLKWFNDRPEGNGLVVATANLLNFVPPELIRSGRFDKIFKAMPFEKEEDYEKLLKYYGQKLEKEFGIPAKAIGLTPQEAKSYQLTGADIKGNLSTIAMAYENYKLTMKDLLEQHVIVPQMRKLDKEKLEFLNKIDAPSAHKTLKDILLERQNKIQKENDYGMDFSENRKDIDIDFF